MAWIEKDSSENIYGYIRRKEKQEDWDSCEGVIIENLSSYPLEYVNCGIVSGKNLWIRRLLLNPKWSMTKTKIWYQENKPGPILVLVSEPFFFWTRI